MKRNNAINYYIFVAVLTCISLFFTIVQKSYNNLIGPQAKVNANQELAPINPAIDKTVFDEIQKREDYASNGVINVYSSDVTPTVVIPTSIPTTNLTPSPVNVSPTPAS